jgi:hypothetical protein
MARGNVVPADGYLAVIAAIVALVPASLGTRSPESDRPGWAIRVYLSLFRSSGLKPLGDVAAARTRYPVREAFLAA